MALEKTGRSSSLLFWAGAFGVLAVGLIVALPLLLPRLVEFAVRRELQARGLEEVAMGPVQVDLAGLTIADLRLGPDDDLLLSRLRVTWSLRDLLAGRLQRVSLQDLRLRSRVAGGISFGALDPLLEGSPSEASGPVVLPFRSLEVESGELHIETAAAVLRAPFEAHVTTGTEEALAATASFSVHDDVELGRGELQFERSAAGALDLRAEISARELPLPLESVPDASVDEGRLELRLSGTAEKASGSLQIGFEVGSASLGHGILDLEAVLRVDQGRLRLTLDDCATLRLESLQLAEGTLSLQQPFESCLRAGEGALLELAANLDPTSRFEAGAVVDSAPLHLRLIPAPEESLSIRGESPKIVFELTGGGEEEGLATSVETSGGSIHWPAFDLRAEGFDSRVELALPGGKPRLVARFGVEAIHDLHSPALVRVLRAEAHGDVHGDAVDFRLRLADEPGDLTLLLNGAHDLATGAGSASLDLEPLRFAAGQPRPSDLFPVLRDLVYEARGEATATGTLSWSPDGLESDLDLGLELTAARTSFADIVKLATTVHLDQIWPPTSPAGQSLTMAGVGIGLDLLDGDVAFQLTPRGDLVIESARWLLAGGTLSTEGRYDPGLEENSFVLQLAGADLAELVAVLEIGDLTATGTLGGEIPATLRNGELWIDDALLEAGPEGGWLRYQAGMPTAEGGGLDLVYQALENFHYETLRITLDGPLAEDMNIGVHLAGANPDLYDGKPIELNLNIEAPIDSLLRASLIGWEIPERIKRRLRENPGDGTQ